MSDAPTFPFVINCLSWSQVDHQRQLITGAGAAVAAAAATSARSRGAAS